MGGISTDVIALGAMLGSAAVGGAVTLALAGEESPQRHEVSVECVQTVVETAPRVSIAIAGEGETVVLAPRVSVRTTEPCVGLVQLERLERELARRRAEFDIDARLEEEMRRLEERLERLDGGNGR